MEGCNVNVSVPIVMEILSDNKDLCDIYALAMNPDVKICPNDGCNGLCENVNTLIPEA